MKNEHALISFYQQKLNLPHATFSRIVHEDALVAIVYAITQPDGTNYILKLCERPHDYHREVYFLTYFANILPVPRILQTVEPASGIIGGILMEHLPGHILTVQDYTHPLAYEAGSLLARIHQNRTTAFGDLTQPNELSSDPHIHFGMKFQEGLAECTHHLPEAIIAKCQRYYDAHRNALDFVDGPCIIHRDFRPGNLVVHHKTIQGIIDWPSARSGFAQEDFASLEHIEWSAHPSLKQSFLAGYSSIRPIPQYDTMMPLLRLSKAIATIGFTLKRNTYNTTSTRLYQLNREFLDNFLKTFD